MVLVRTTARRPVVALCDVVVQMYAAAVRLTDEAVVVEEALWVAVDSAVAISRKKRFNLCVCVHIRLLFLRVYVYMCACVCVNISIANNA